MNFGRLQKKLSSMTMQNFNEFEASIEFQDIFKTSLTMSTGGKLLFKKLKNQTGADPNLKFCPLAEKSPINDQS